MKKKIEKEGEVEADKRVEEKMMEKKQKQIVVAYPSALKERKKVEKYQKVFELLKQVTMNIPLIDMIKQVPLYAKYF